MKRFLVYFHMNPRVPKANCAYVEAEDLKGAELAAEALVSKYAAVALRDGIHSVFVQEDTTRSFESVLEDLRADTSRGPLRAPGGGYEA